MITFAIGIFHGYGVQQRFGLIVVDFDLPSKTLVMPQFARLMPSAKCRTTSLFTHVTLINPALASTCSIVNRPVGNHDAIQPNIIIFCNGHFSSWNRLQVV